MHKGYQHDLAPVVAEDYGEHEEGLSNYAVALIKRNLSKDISFRSLGKAKACHPAAGDLIRWTVPAGLLIGLDVMPWKNCDPYQSSAEFFLESCVPGLLGISFINAYNIQNWGMLFSTEKPPTNL